MLPQKAKAPKLNKLGTQEWTKTKSKVKGAVNEVAKDLVKLYAASQNTEKVISTEKILYGSSEFEEMFPYEETRGSAPGALMRQKRIWKAGRSWIV